MSPLSTSEMMLSSLQDRGESDSEHTSIPPNNHHVHVRLHAALSVPSQKKMQNYWYWPENLLPPDSAQANGKKKKKDVSIHTVPSLGLAMTGGGGTVLAPLSRLCVHGQFVGLPRMMSEKNMTSSSCGNRRRAAAMAALKTFTLYPASVMPHSMIIAWAATDAF